MNRSFSTFAVILNIKPFGENNSTVTLLTNEKGIIYATLYGGPKSKLRSLVTLWNFGTIWLYENQEKKQIKITDFEVKNYHSTFSQNLFKMYSASLVAEICIKTQCAGSPKECFKLVVGFFDGMEIVNEQQAKTGLVRFLWRFLELLGIQPQSHCCSFCGKSFLEYKLFNHCFYNFLENTFFCDECVKNDFSDFQNRNFFYLDKNAIQYLCAISVLDFCEVRKLKITENEYEQIKQILFFILEHNLEQKLNSIETGQGIF